MMRRPQARGSRRWLAAAVGLMACAAYAGGAWLSGSLSPMARRALLDTTFIPQPYRWVSPPPPLAAKNKIPDHGDFTISFTGADSDPGVFATTDMQISVVLSKGAIPKAPGATSVHMTVDPLDPATIAPLPKPLSVLGNVYRIDATYQPGGAPVPRLGKAVLLLMAYPALATHGPERDIEYSPDGKTWTKLTNTTDPVNLQVSSNLKALNGYYVVATTGSVTFSGTPSPGPSGGSGGGGTAVYWIVIGAALVVAGALAVVRIRSRAHAREFTSYREAADRERAERDRSGTATGKARRPAGSSKPTPKGRRRPPPKPKRR
jgi:hypothetical protein